MRTQVKEIKNMKKNENWYEVYWHPTYVTAKTKGEAEEKVDRYVLSNDPDGWMDADFIELDEETTKKMQSKEDDKK